MDKLLDSWAPLTLICGMIFAIAFGGSMALGIAPFSLTSLGWDFLCGCFIGFMVYILFKE